MRKRLAIVALAVAVAAVVLPTIGSSATIDDVKGLPCADIVLDNGTATTAGFYDSTGVHFRLALAAPSCRQVTYTLYVLDATGTTLLSSSSTKGTGADTITLASAGSGDSVCVYLTTSIGKHVFDRAPDTGCGVLALDGGSGATGFH